MAAASAAGWALGRRELARECRRCGLSPAYRGSAAEWPLLLSFSLPAALGGFLVGPVNWACASMLVNRPEGYHEMGLFTAAVQWRAVVLFLPGVIGQVALPLLSGAGDDPGRGRFREFLALNGRVTVGAALAVSLPLILLASPAMGAWGPGFEEGAGTLRVLCAGAVLMAANAVMGQAIAVRGSMWAGFAFNGLWALVLTGVSWTLVQRGWGAEGLAWGTLAAYAAHTGWQALYLMKIRHGKARGGKG
jgi:O-antigen/teichoic acid export membrane protein